MTIFRVAIALAGAIAAQSAFPADKTRQYSSDDVRVWMVGTSTFSTDCTDSSGNVSTRRKIAMLGASRGIVKYREGVHISGRERLFEGEFRSVVDEDALGIVRPLKLVDEFEAQDGEKVLLCITVKEESVSSGS